LRARPAVHIPADPDGFVAIGGDHHCLVDVERPAVVPRQVVHIRRIGDDDRVEVLLAHPLFGPSDPALVLGLVEDMLSWHDNRASTRSINQEN